MILGVTADQIATLNDRDLRTLVGCLCEREVRAHGHSPAAVTWGGQQNAADAGIDVRVALDGDDNDIRLCAQTGYRFSSQSSGHA